MTYCKLARFDVSYEFRQESFGNFNLSKKLREKHSISNRAGRFLAKNRGKFTSLLRSGETENDVLVSNFPISFL